MLATCAASSKSIFAVWLLTVITKQKKQAVQAINQSTFIFLDVYGAILLSPCNVLTKDIDEFVTETFYR